MSEFGFIYVFLIGLALCIAALIIINIREDRSALEKEKEDFITAFYQRKKHMLEVNIPPVTIRTYLALSIAAPLFFEIVFWFLLPNKSFATMMAAFTVFLPDFVIRIMADLKKKKYEERYVRALKAFASALRSGMSIQQAVQDVADNPFISSDVSVGFRQIDSDLRVGISIEESFRRFAEAADNDDARDVASAISMQAAVGGSEAKVIDNIAANIEDRLMTRKRIRAIFASTDFMINAFDVLPFLAVLLIYVSMPDYANEILNDPLSFLVCVAVLVFTLIGSVIIRERLKEAKGE